MHPILLGVLFLGVEILLRVPLRARVVLWALLPGMLRAVARLRRGAAFAVLVLLERGIGPHMVLLAALLVRERVRRTTRLADGLRRTATLERVLRTVDLAPRTVDLARRIVDLRTAVVDFALRVLDRVRVIGRRAACNLEWERRTTVLVRSVDRPRCSFSLPILAFEGILRSFDLLLATLRRSTDVARRAFDLLDLLFLTPPIPRICFISRSRFARAIAANLAAVGERHAPALLERFCERALRVLEGTARDADTARRRPIALEIRRLLGL